MATKTASKSQSKSSGKTSSSNSASKSAGAKSLDSRTYDSDTNTWKGNGVTTYSSDGSQSTGKKTGSYDLTQEKSAIGWVPVATRVQPQPVTVAPRSSGSGPGSSGLLPARPIAVRGPGNAVGAVASPAQAPIHLGEIVVTANKPKPQPAGPGAAVAAPTQVQRPPRPKGGTSTLSPAFVSSPGNVLAAPGPGQGYDGGYRYMDIGLGLTWATPKDMAPAEDAEDEMGDGGSLPYQGWKLGVETIVNGGRILNTFDATLTNWADSAVGGVKSAAGAIGSTVQPRDYSGNGNKSGGTGNKAPW